MKNELWTLLAAGRPTGIPGNPPLPIDGLNGVLGSDLSSVPAQ